MKTLLMLACRDIKESNRALPRKLDALGCQQSRPGMPLCRAECAMQRLSPALLSSCVTQSVGGAGDGGPDWYPTCDPHAGQAHREAVASDR